MSSGKPYEFPDDWDEYSLAQKQRFFETFRQRVYWYWFNGNSGDDESEFRVTETLE